MECVKRCGATFDNVPNFVAPGKYNLLSVSTSQNCADTSDNGGRVKCKGGYDSAWHLFELEPLDASRMVVKGSREGFAKYCSDNGRDGMQCNRGSAGSWEKFYPVHLSGSGAGATYMMKGSKDNRWCYVKGGDDTRIVCDRSHEPRNSVDGHFRFISYDVADAVDYYQRGVNRKSCIEQNRDVC